MDAPITCSAQAAALASFSTKTGLLLKLLKSIEGYSFAILPVEPNMPVFSLLTAPHVAKAITSTSSSYFEIISLKTVLISSNVFGVGLFSISPTIFPLSSMLFSFLILFEHIFL